MGTPPHLFRTFFRKFKDKRPFRSFSPFSDISSVLRTPLSLHSRSPITGFFRDGYCRTGPGDHGNHAIAGILTKDFLDFTANRGNNLRAAGLTEGCKWCLCTSRWKEAVQAAEAAGGGGATGTENGPLGKEVVPKVVLQATDESALGNGVTLDLLRKYAADADQANGNGSGSGA